MQDDDKTWHIEMVRAREALDIILPKLINENQEADWGDIWVAHPDTGYTQNPVFAFEGDRSPFLLTDRGVNYLEPGELPRDPLRYSGFPGHGTRIGSALCGRLPGSLVGLAPGVPTVPYRVTNSVVLIAREARPNLAHAIRHAIDFNGCDVISISLGMPLLSPFAPRPLGRAVDYAYENGVIVAAAGGQVVDRVSYPGKFRRSIGVGGVTPDRKVWPGSEYVASMKERIDVWAPAEPIWRANTVFDGSGERYDFGFGDGTSYSTVHVSAAAALWLFHRKEEIAGKYARPWQRVEAFRRLIKDTRQDVKGRFKPAPGTGILDMEALLKAELPELSDDDYEEVQAAGEWG